MKKQIAAFMAIFEFHNGIDRLCDRSATQSISTLLKVQVPPKSELRTAPSRHCKSKIRFPFINFAPYLFKDAANRSNDDIGLLGRALASVRSASAKEAKSWGAF